MFTKLKQTSQAGFTGIEVLMVLVIVIIITILVTNNIQESQAKARDTERRIDILTIYDRLENYWHVNQSYPDDVLLIYNQEANDEQLALALIDPSGNRIQVDPALSSANRPAASYTSAKPEFEYTYIAYNCSGIETDDTTQEANQSDSTTAEVEADDNAETEEIESEEPSCRNYVLYTWLEKPSNLEEFYFSKDNLH